MSIALSPRLRRIADYVPQGSTVVDVGTDHAYIPIWLLQEGRSERAYATDVKAGPLARAAADAEKYGVTDRLRLFLCDGLALCPPDSVDTVILAGMGGETMLGILERSPWALEKRLIVQPQTKCELLRSFLASHGRCIRDAALAYDTGRIYLVWLVGEGEQDPTEVVDHALLEHRDPLLKPWLEDRIKRCRKQLRGLELARSPEETALDALRRELTALEEQYREVLKW